MQEVRLAAAELLKPGRRHPVRWQMQCLRANKTMAIKPSPRTLTISCTATTKGTNLLARVLTPDHLDRHRLHAV